MRFARIVVGLVLIVTSVANVLFWSDPILSGRQQPLSLLALGLAAAMYVGGVCILYQGLPGYRPRRDLRTARRVAFISLTLATLMAGIAAPAVALLLQGNPVPSFPWTIVVHAGALFAVILFAWLGIWKAPSLVLWPAPPRIDDPFDPPAPPDDMIEPDPGPTLHALLARKRSLNLSRAH